MSFLFLARQLDYRTQSYFLEQLSQLKEIQKEAVTEVLDDFGIHRVSATSSRNATGSRTTRTSSAEESPPESLKSENSKDND